MEKYKEEQYRIAYERDHWQCANCGKKASQIAHGVPDRKHLIKKYGYKIINHASNLRPACDLKCNAVLQKSPWEWDSVVDKIKEELTETPVIVKIDFEKCLLQD